MIFLDFSTSCLLVHLPALQKTLSGVKRTLIECVAMSAFDPKRTWNFIDLNQIQVRRAAIIVNSTITLLAQADVMPEALGHFLNSRTSNGGRDRFHQN
jgi:hypothetical protein